MKNLIKHIKWVLLVSTFMTGPKASATAINVLGAGDFPANTIKTITGKNGLGDANVLAWIQAEAALALLPSPTTAQSVYLGGPITAGDYLVLHYGVGPGGTQATGGGLVGLYFDANEASFNVPANGSGPNGLGGISFARLFVGGGVPDGGSSLVLLGLGLAGISAMAHRRSKA